MSASTFSFKLRFAFRNIVGNIGRSLVVFFTMTIVAALVVTGFCLDDAFRKMFTLQQTETYLDVDFVMSFDANSQTRIINKRIITQKYADHFRFYASFFNIYAYLETTAGTDYIKVMASSVAEMENVIDYDLPSLAAYEAVIPDSFAAAYQLAPGDGFDLYIGGDPIRYIVKAIIPDRGLFKDKTVFVDKTELLEIVYGVDNLGNLGNTVYFSLASGVDIDAAMADLLAEDAYSSFVFTKVVDETEIARMASFNASIFAGIGVMAILALILVLRSVFPILFKEFTAQIGVIKTLGGSDRFAFHVWLLEFALILAGAIPIGMLLSWSLFQLAGPVIGVQGLVTFNPWLILAAVASLLLFLFAELFFRFRKLKQQAAIALSSDRRAEAVTSPALVFVISLVLIAVNRLTGWWMSPIFRLAEILLILLASFAGMSALLTAIAGLARKTKSHSTFGLFTARHLAGDKVAHNALKVGAMSIIVIAVTLMLNNFIIIATDEFRNQITADYVLTNIFDYDEDLRTEIMTEFAPESVDEGSFYRNAVFMSGGYEKRIQYLISLDFERMGDYFSFSIDTSVGTLFADRTKAYILLPIAIGKVYGVKEGDEVQLKISKDLPDVTFTVAGFLDTYYDSIAITNLVNVDAYADLAPVNALLMNAADGEAFATAIVKRYSTNMYFLFNADEVIADVTDMYLSIANYLTIIGWAVVFCFMIVILNNAVLVFDAMKADYARLMVLGVSGSKLNGMFAAEAGIMTAIAAVTAIINIALFFPAMPELMLLFRNYKRISLEWPIALIGVGGGILVFLIGYGSYFFKVRRLRIVEEIKKY